MLAGRVWVPGGLVLVITLARGWKLVGRASYYVILLTIGTQTSELI